MEYKTFIEVIKESCSFLEDDGYVLREVDKNVWYEKATLTEGFRISFNCIQYNDLKVQGLAAYKRFNIVEEKIQKVIGRELIDCYTIREDEDSIFLESNIPAGLSFVQTEHNCFFTIKEESDIFLFIQVVQNFYKKLALPFFDKYKTIQDIENWITHTPMEKHQDKIVGWHNTMMLRKLIILKEISSKEFASLYPRYKKHLLRKKAENESPYVDMCNVFEKLIPYFEIE